MVRAVVFDYGNVISETQTGDCAEEMQRITGVPAGVFRSVYDRFRFEFDRGTITGAEMYARLLVADGYGELAADRALMERIARLDMQSWRAWRRDVTDWALSLKKSGLKLGILSNMPTEFLESYGHEIPLFAAADYACFSCKVGFIKPEPEIYRDALQGLGLEADECVFFDDVQENVDAARRVGMEAFLWNGLEQAKRNFAEAVRVS